MFAQDVADTLFGRKSDSTWVPHTTDGFHEPDSWMIPALRAEIPLPTTAVAVISRANELMRIRLSAGGAADAILHRVKKENRTPTPTEQDSLDSLSARELRARHSLDSTPRELKRLLPGALRLRIGYWVEEQWLVSTAASGTMEDLFAQYWIAFGPAYAAAPETLAATWQYIQGTPAYRSIITERTRRALLSLPGRKRLRKDDAERVALTIQDFVQTAQKLRMELSVAEYTSPAWRAGAGMEPDYAFDAYTHSLVQSIGFSRARLMRNVAPLVGASPANLERTWMP